MNFLTMCQKAILESGISGNGPATVQEVKGIEAKIVNWVQRAWINIQEMRQDWVFQHKRISFNLSPGKSDYTLVELGIDDIDRWELKNAVIFPVSDPTQSRPLESYTYDDWLNSQLSIGPADIGPTNQVTTISGTFNDLMFWPIPDQEYTVSLEYYRAPVELLADNDTPHLQPANLHWAIVWLALIYYATYDGAPEVDSLAREQWERYIGMIDSRYKPQMSLDIADVTIGGRAGGPDGWVLK